MSIQFGSASSNTLHSVQGAHSQIPSFPITMSIWFYSNRTSGREPLLSFICTDFEADGEPFELSLSMLSNATTTNRRVEAVVYDWFNGIVRAQTQTGAGAGWSTNSWVHAAGIFESSIRTPFLNGESSGSNTILFSNPSEFTSNPSVRLNMSVGSSPVIIGHDTEGQQVSMAEAAIWNTVLEKEEIFALSRGAKPKTIRPEFLIFYSPLVRGNSYFVSEETGNCPEFINYHQSGPPPWEATPSYGLVDHPRRYG